VVKASYVQLCGKQLLRLGELEVELNKYYNKCKAEPAAVESLSSFQEGGGTVEEIG
jgi:hypothetical protein